MLFYEELLALVILIAGMFGLYIFMKYKDKGYKDDNGEYIVMPRRRKD